MIIISNGIIQTFFISVAELCPRLPSIPNGQIIRREEENPDFTNLGLFKVAEYSCDSGSSLAGPQRQICHPAINDGKWSSTQPECIGKYEEMQSF